MKVFLWSCFCASRLCSKRTTEAKKVFRV
jgi:hypothetical protein